MKTTHCCFRRSGVNIGYYYGRISGPIWSNNFRCSGNESSLEECRHDGGGYRSCSHQQDVSIVCGNSTCKSRNCFVITALYCRHVILSQRSCIFPRLFIFSQTRNLSAGRADLHQKYIRDWVFRFIFNPAQRLKYFQ